MGRGYTSPYTFNSRACCFWFIRDSYPYTVSLEEGMLHTHESVPLPPFPYGPILQATTTGGNIYALGSDGVIYTLSPTDEWISYFQLPAGQKIIEFVYRRGYRASLFAIDRQDRYYVYGSYQTQYYQTFTLIPGVN